MKGRRSERQQSSRKESREHLSASDILRERERERSTRQRVPLPPSDELKKRVRDRVSHSSLSLSFPPSLSPGEGKAGGGDEKRERNVMEREKNSRRSVEHRGRRERKGRRERRCTPLVSEKRAGIVFLRRKRLPSVTHACDRREGADSRV